MKSKIGIKMKISEIDVKNAKKLLDEGKAILIDVREIDEYKEASIPNSYLSPLSLLSSINLPKNIKGKDLIFHCKSGKRSMAVCQFMQAEGDDSSVEKVYNLVGGIEAWQACGLPIVKSCTISINRQVQITAGSLIFTSIALGYLLSSAWFLLAGFIGIGLVFSGYSGWCGMALLLKWMPWNKSIRKK